MERYAYVLQRPFDAEAPPAWFKAGKEKGCEVVRRWVLGDGTHLEGGGEGWRLQPRGRLLELAPGAPESGLLLEVSRFERRSYGSRFKHLRFLRETDVGRRWERFWVTSAEARALERFLEEQGLPEPQKTDFVV